METGCLSQYEQSFLIKTRARLKMITRLKTILIEWSQELKDFSVEFESTWTSMIRKLFAEGEVHTI